MELHHKLRRDPSWHPSSCNICGQMGHQAAHCTVGTVNWRAMYGDHVFVLKRPVFPSEIYAKQKAKHIDFESLEQRAKDFAKAREEGKTPAEINAQSTEAHAAAHPPAAAAPPPARAPEEEGLAPGWAVAKDAQGRVYFWHTETKQVQWDKPTIPQADADGDQAKETQQQPDGDTTNNNAEQTTTAAAEEVMAGNEQNE